MKVTDKSQSLLNTYEAAGRASRALLSAAREGDWNEFDRLQARCREIVTTLRTNGTRPALPPDLARRRHEILTGILADDRQIRDILQPTTRSFDEIMRLRLDEEARPR